MERTERPVAMQPAPSVRQPAGAMRPAILIAVALLVASAVYLWAVRGQAILLDMAGSIGAMLCM